ncbi:alpha/beta fold hydrolase [Tateyamaria sp. SN6-1]|uniref:alpha/beta fold hydrolase n=1 Tax=Tateyamaria sp. SN6-1 TaxID=3092148 RepID=UPI0039F51ADE
MGGEALVLEERLRDCDRFFHTTFGDIGFPATLYDYTGRKLVDKLVGGESALLPEQVAEFKNRGRGPRFFVADNQLLYIYDRMDHWPHAPEDVSAVALSVSKDWISRNLDLHLTQSEYVLVSFLLSGCDLKAAAERVGAGYDTKRKQIRQVLGKACAKNQASLLRDLSLDISAHALKEILRPHRVNPETSLARDCWGRDVVVHNISLDECRDIPIWDFGARRGQPLLFFHSMVAPIIFSKGFVQRLKHRNLRLLMVPRHFAYERTAFDRDQAFTLQIIAEAVDILCDEPVICIGESAGGSWASRFAYRYPNAVSQLILTAIPEVSRNGASLGAGSVLSELSERIKADWRVVAGTARIYNAIARNRSIATKTLKFMFRDSQIDLQTVEAAFLELNLAKWLRLIANSAKHASIDEFALLQSNWLQELRSTDVPIHFIHGKQDPLSRPTGVAILAASLQNAKFTEFPDAGHFVLGQKFDDILDSLFLDETRIY